MIRDLRTFVTELCDAQGLQACAVIAVERGTLIVQIGSFHRADTSLDVLLYLGRTTIALSEEYTRLARLRLIGAQN